MVSNTIGDVKTVPASISDCLKFQSIPVFTMETDGKIQEINPYFARISGYTCSELKGHSISKIILHDLLVVDELQETLTEGKDCFEHEIKFLSKSLDIVWLKVHGTRIKDLYLVICENISRLKDAELQVQEGKRTYNTLLSNLSGMVYKCRNDEARTMELVSEGCFQLTGYKPSDLIFNKSVCWNNLIDPAFRDYVRDHFRERLENSLPCGCEYKIITKSGEVKWVWEKAKGVFQNGKLVSIEGFITEITETKLFQERLESTENLLQNVFESINDRLFFTSDLSINKITHISNSAETFFGVESHDLKNPWFLKDFLIQEDKNILDRIITELENGTTQKIEHRLINNKSEIKWVETVLKPVLKKKKLQKIEGVISDITERKVYEESLKLFREQIDHTMDAIFVIDLESGRFTDVNMTACNRLGYNREEMLSLNIQNISETFNDPSWHEFVSEAKIQGNVILEEYLLAKDKTYIPFEINVRYFTRADHEYMIAIARDITERKLNEEWISKRHGFESIISLIASDFINMSHQDIDAGIIKALSRVAYYSGMDRGFLLTLAEDSKTASITHEWCRKEIPSVKENMDNYSVAMFPKWMHRLNSFEIIQIPDVSELGADLREERSILEHLGTKSLILIPMIYKKAIIGFFAFDSTKSVKYWDEDDIRMLNMLSSNLVNALKRKRMEEKLSNKERFLSKVIDVSPNIIFVKDKNRKYVLANNALTTLYKCSLNEIIGKTDDDFNMLSDEIELFNKTDNEVLNFQRQTAPFEEKVTNKLTGEIRWFQTIKTPLVTDEGELQILGVGVDITELKNITEALTKQKNYLNQIINATPNLIFVKDWEGKFRIVNEAFAKLFKSDVNTFLENQKNVSGLQHFLEEDREVIKNRKVTQPFEEAIPDPETGEAKWFQTSKVPLDCENGDVEMLGISIDITERKIAEGQLIKNENLLKTINENILAGIYRSNHDGMIYVNQPFVELFGYNSTEEIMNIDINDLYVHVEDRIDLITEVDESEFVNNKEIRLRRKNGEEFWALVSSRKTVDEDYNVFYDGAIRDITELKQTEQILIQKNHELEKVNNELDKFVYSVSHDLRAPLASVLGLVTIAELESDPGNYPGYFSMIRNTVEKLDRFIQDIIHYSRNSRLSVQSEEIDFNALVNETIENLRYMPNFNKINFSTEIKPGTPYLTDISRLRIVFNNLVSNAIKYCDHAKSESFVKIIIEQSSDHCHIQISDNGIGIADEYTGKIFDMFFRATQENVGSGLGLYIVKETVSKLGGSISVLSELKNGTTFIINIPGSE